MLLRAAPERDKSRDAGKDRIYSGKSYDFPEKTHFFLKKI